MNRRVFSNAPWFVRRGQGGNLKFETVFSAATRDAALSTVCLRGFHEIDKARDYARLHPFGTGVMGRGKHKKPHTKKNKITRHNALAPDRSLAREWILNKFKVFKERRPLAATIEKQLLAAAKGVIPKSELKEALERHLKSRRYVRNLIAGSPRYNLVGTPAGEVTPQESEGGANATKSRSQQNLILKAKLLPLLAELPSKT